MEGKGYLDFDLRFAKSENGYRAEILKSPAGTAEGIFRMPFQDIELENYLLKIGQRRSGMRKIDSPENRAARDFGSKLYDGVFQGDVQTVFRKSIDAARAADYGLRVRLHLADTPELADLPWEYLWQPQRREFLALTTETPIVRYFDLPETVKPLAVTPPLRVLVMLSNPSDVDCLDVEKEWQQLKQAIGHLEERKLLIVERLEKATLSKLQNRLRKAEYHVFHFVGHGSFDPSTQESVLALEDEDGRKRLVSGPDLGIYLRDEPSLRLVLLNACEGARASRTDPFSGAAQSLVLKGIPAVIAMQFEVSDEAAIAMASGFYAALSDDYPVDAALAEARKAVFAAGCTVEWGTPVLYLRAPDGRIFDVDKEAAPKPEVPPERVVSPPLPPVPVAPPQPSFVRPESEPVPTRAAIEKRSPRPWRWLATGIVATFIAFLILGAFISEKEKRDKEKQDALAFASPSATAEPVNESSPFFTPAPVASKFQSEPMNVPATKYAPAPTASSKEEEFKSIKSQIQDLAVQQKQTSKVLDEMDNQARAAIKDIRTDDSSQNSPEIFPSPESGAYDGQLAGATFQPSGWWRVVTNPPYAVSRVLYNSNGRFSGTAVDAAGTTTNLSGSWSYVPATSMLNVNYDNGAWARVVLVHKGRGFYSSFTQNYVTNEVYMENESQAPAPNKSKKY